MTETALLLEKSEGFAVLTMNRPEAMNALNKDLADALFHGFQEVNNDESIKVLILTGAGKAFCGGLDLKEIAKLDQSLSGSEMSNAIGQFHQEMFKFKGPIIGAINGPAVTGGVELALRCDILIASTKGSFADTHARVGFIPGGGMTQILPRIIGTGRAKQLSFTGNFLDANTAESWGLVNQVVAPDKLLDVCRAMARDMLPGNQFVIQEYKRLIDQGNLTTVEEGLKAERDAHVDYAQQSTQNFDDSKRQAIQKRGREQIG